FVESLSFPAFMNQPALYHLPRLQIQHCHLLEARMKVTTDILHMRPPSSRALGLKQIEFTRDDLEAVVVIQSSGALQECCRFGRSLSVNPACIAGVIPATTWTPKTRSSNSYTQRICLSGHVCHLEKISESTCA